MNRTGRVYDRSVFGRYLISDIFNEKNGNIIEIPYMYFPYKEEKVSEGCEIKFNGVSDDMVEPVILKLQGSTTMTYYKKFR